MALAGNERDHAGSTARWSPDGTRNHVLVMWSRSMRVRASRFRPFFSTVSHSRFHRPAGGSFSWSGARGARGVGGWQAVPRLGWTINRGGFKTAT